MTRYAIGLGSNVGDRIGILRGAVGSLSDFGEVTELSSVYETEPVGGPDQDPFLNCVAVLESWLDPESLLARLQALENEAGRVRAVRWGPRTLDLDIVTSDGEAIKRESLVIPHPRAKERAFVLQPLAEVWPSAEVGSGLTAAEALEKVADQGVDKLARRWLDESAHWLGAALVTVQFAWFLGTALAMAWDGSLPGDSVGPLRVVGLLLALVGAVLAFISSRRLGPAMTAHPEPRAEGELIDSGPYRLARHPIYGGVTLFLLGAALIVDSLLGTVLSLGLLPFFYLKSEYEERRLRIKYPGYRAYRMRVTRRLIPFVI